MKHLAIGVDIGGTHVSCAACDIQKQIYLADTFQSSPLNNQGSVQEIITIWADTIQRTLAQIGTENCLGIGFAMPGPFDYVNGIALFQGNNKKYEALYGVSIPHMIRQKLGLSDTFPIRFINDATAFALGEDCLGELKGSERSLAITLGTGFGSAFLSDHLPVVAGEEVPEFGCVWHLPFKDGNADDYFSTRGLVGRYEQLSGEKLPGVKEIAMRVDQDPKVQELFDDFGEQLALFLHTWITRFRAEKLVVGGSIARNFHLFEKKMNETLQSVGSLIQVESSKLLESAAMIGSATLVDPSYYKKVEHQLPLM